MSQALAGILICIAIVVPPVGTELTYSGTLHRQSKNGVEVVKTFDLFTLIMTDEDGSSTLAYHLDERGGGSWGWPEHFGQISLAHEGVVKSRPIRILHSHESQQYPISVRTPLFEFPEKLKSQSSWNDGRFEYVVGRKRKVRDRDCLQVEVSSNSGRVQTLVIEVASGILMSLEERVTLGRGDEFQLKMEFESQNRLSDADRDRAQETISSLVSLQKDLKRTGDQKVVELDRDQIQVVKLGLPRFEKESEGISWSRIVAAIGRDLQQQQKRLDGLAGLQKKLVGSPAPEWKLQLTDGISVSDSDAKGRIVVLHFWQYRGEPLSEPYGQVGYLDFLYGKRKKLGVRVIGVNVDERFANSQQTGPANRAMKSFLEFMKLDYEMAIDDGTTLSSFGDPRVVGSPLPLWIVIGHDGTVLHHHSGFYDIKPDEGLKELDEAIIDAVRRQKSKQ